MKKKLPYRTFSNAITFKIDAKEIEYLFVRKSQIPDSGNGLFTAIRIYKDEVISVFKGEILSAKESKQRAFMTNDHYFINLPDGKIMDSMKTKCFAKFANDPLGFVKSNFKVNSKITLDENGNVCILASKDIIAGEEIFCTYGKAYWIKQKKNKQF